MLWTSFRVGGVERQQTVIQTPLIFLWAPFALSLLFFLPVSVCPLQPSITHEVQRLERVSEASWRNAERKQQERRWGKGNEESRDTYVGTLLFRCRMVQWKTVWRGERLIEGTSDAWYSSFFPLPCNIIFKFEFISDDGRSSVEEVHCKWRIKRESLV